MSPPPSSLCDTVIHPSHSSKEHTHQLNGEVASLKVSKDNGDNIHEETSALTPTEHETVSSEPAPTSEEADTEAETDDVSPPEASKPIDLESSLEVTKSKETQSDYENTVEEEERPPV